MGKIQIYNGRVVTPFRIIENGCVLVEDGKILKVQQGDVPDNAAIDKWDPYK